MQKKKTNDGENYQCKSKTENEKLTPMKQRKRAEEENVFSQRI